MVSLNRVILSVQDVERLAAFYRDAFGIAVTEEIKGEWRQRSRPKGAS